MKVNGWEVQEQMGPEFHLSPYGMRFFESQLPKLIMAINRLADAMEKENELKQEEKKNDQSEN